MAYNLPLYAYALICLGYILGIGTDIVYFVKIWTIVIAFGVVSNAMDQIKFYKWFYTCRISESNMRGFSTYAYPFFGILNMPIVSPETLMKTIVGLVMSLLALSYTQHPVFVATSLVLFMIYSSSLWAERTCSYHREAMVITVLLYLLFAPELYGYTGMTPELIKLHITSIYAISIVQKLEFSVIQRKFWPFWSPHGFLWKAMWSDYHFPKIQKFLFLNPKITSICGILTMFAEVGLLFQWSINRHLLYFALLCFHLAVFIVQGIDYITFWVPVLIIGAVGTTNFVFAWMHAPGYVLLFAQTLFAVLQLENFNINLPPLTSTPMFVTIASLDDKMSNNYSIVKLDNDIEWYRIRWMYPFVKLETSLGFNNDDEKKLPQEYFTFGYVGKMPKIFDQFIVDMDTKVYFMTNMTLDKNNINVKNTINKIESLMIDLHGEHSDYDPYKNLEEVYERYHEIMRAFIEFNSQEL